MSLGVAYLEPIEFELEFLLIIQELLQPVRQHNVRIVQPAIFLVELVILVYFLAFLLTQLSD